jgi:hypothetical protein
MGGKPLPITFTRIPRLPLSASPTTKFRFDLPQGVGAILGGDHYELLTVRVTAVDFVKTSRRIARPADNGCTRENVVHERSGLGAVKQAGARLSF